MSAILWLALNVCGAEPPATLPLVAEEKWYREAKEKESTWEGVLERNAASARIGGPARFNAYRLAWFDGAGKPGRREIHAPGKAYLLADHIGKKVRLAGKAVDTVIDGQTYNELWPARLEFLDRPVMVAKLPAAVEGIYARCTWQPESGLHREPRLFVFREPKLLVSPLRLTGSGAEDAATEMMAKRLNVPAINWKKQMVVSVSAGLAGRTAERVTITRVSMTEQTLTIRYSLKTPPGGAVGLGLPAETVLVDRFDGEVRIELETPRPE